MGSKNKKGDGALATALLIALTVVLILAVLTAGGCGPGARGAAAGTPAPAPRAPQHPAEPGGAPPRAYRQPWRGNADMPWREGPGLSTSSAMTQVSPDATFLGDEPQRRSVYSALSRLYSTADADPLITGQLYGFSDGVRNVYAERTSHGDIRGLTEYSSSGGVGDVGIDIGPFGLDEYGGRAAGFDDGIPGPWALPSTPVRWYAPKQRDYYGPEGPTVYSEGLYSLWEPDHDPRVN